MRWRKQNGSRVTPQKRQTIGRRARDRPHEAMAGLLARGSPTDADLPGLPVVETWRRLVAYSCGVSRGFGVATLTVFPFDPRREPSSQP